MLGTPRSRRASRPATERSRLSAMITPHDLEVIGPEARSLAARRPLSNYAALRNTPRSSAQRYVSASPSRSECFGDQPSALIFALSSNLRGVPSGFDASNTIVPE